MHIFFFILKLSKKNAEILQYKFGGFFFSLAGNVVFEDLLQNFIIVSY